MAKKSIVLFISVLLFSILFIWVGYGLYGCYEHTKLLGTEIEISAVVTRHRESDDEYYSYVNYSYNGKTYRYVEFENRSIEKELTAVGETVTVEIFPDSPEKLARETPGNSILSVHVGFIVLLILLFSVISKPHSKDEYLTPPSESEIKYHLKSKYRNRLMKIISPIIGCVVYVILMLIFPEFFGLVMPCVCTGISLIIVLYYIVNTVRFISVELRTVRETLVKKYEFESVNTDGPDTTSYYLCFKCDEREWEKSVSFKNYEAVCEGEVFQCVYAGKSAKKPVLAFREGACKLVLYF